MVFMKIVPSLSLWLLKKRLFGGTLSFGCRTFFENYTFFREVNRVCVAEIVFPKSGLIEELIRSHKDYAAPYKLAFVIRRGKSMKCDYRRGKGPCIKY